MPGKTEHKEKATDDAHPFGMPWLDSCYQETLLPSGPWNKVSEQISEGLASRMAKQFNHRERKQMIFELMGPDFVRKYFPEEQYDPLVIEEPNITSDTRTKLQLDAQNWLQNALTKVCSETGAVRPVPNDQADAPMSEEMQEFLQHTRFLFNKGMNRHLYLQEKEIEKKWEDLQWEKEKVQKKTRESRERYRLQREHERLKGGQSTASFLLPGTAAGPKSILKKNGRRTPATRLSTAASSTGSNSPMSRPPYTANVKGALFGTPVDPPVFWGMQSNSLGRSLIAILKRDPRRFREISAKLHGRQLPGALKTYIWMDQLLKQERERQNDVHVETVVRERFGKQVSRGASELKIKRATHSPISGLIENAVIETYDKTPAMKPFVEDSLSMKEAAKALNVLYVYDRSYEPYLIHWLFPLQQCFQDASGESEHAYELAMYLDLLHKSLFPKWPEIFASAEKVMMRLKGADPELHDHMKAISQRDAYINPKDFLIQLIHEEKSQAEALLKMNPSNERFNSMSKELLADPLVFLRKWMGEGFVGVLDTQAAIFVWDQCFLQRWQQTVLEDACIALLLLLKHKFMAAKNYKQMKQVFLRDPALLYTHDIQRAWLHIQNRGLYPEVPYLNRLRPKTPEARDTTARKRKSPTPSVSSTSPLDVIGLKQIRLTLNVPAESIERERWLASLDLRNLRLDCSIFFGSIKMAADKTQHLPVNVTNVEKDSYGTLIYRLEYPDDRLIFDNLDIGKYDLEMEMGGVPFAVLELKYKLDTVKDELTLGWTRVKLYQHRSEMSEKAVPEGQQWVRMDGDYSYTIYGGPTLERFANDPTKTPMPTGTDLLGTGCQLGIVIYNPRSESTGPPRKTPTPAPRRITPTPTPRRTPVVPKKTPTPKKGLGLNDSFDIYIDALSNIPDNSTITKVTGRFVKTGDVKDVPDILALPELSSPARNPRFKYKLTLNEDTDEFDSQLVVLLRVYTIDLDTRELVVIGSCLFQLFSSDRLKVGNYCRQIHSGMPDLNQGLAGIHQEALDDAPRVPGCRLYYRITQHSQNYSAPPALDKYQVLDPAFNASEKRVVLSFGKDQHFPKTVKNAIKDMRELEEENEGDRNKDPMLWVSDRLDNKKHLAPNQPAENLDIHRLVRYRIKTGFNVRIVRAYGLPEGQYVQCFARTVPGKKALRMAVTPDGFGKDEKLITVKHDWESLQSAPQWRDETVLWHPHLDDNTCIIVQIYAINPTYKPNADHKSPGKLTKKDGGRLTLGDNDLLGWAVVPLFEKDYVLNGEHHVPIFKNKPDEDLLHSLQEELPEDVIGTKEWDSSSKYDSAALVVNIWDAHYSEDEIPGGLVKTDFLLDVLENKDLYIEAENNKKGKKMFELLTPHLAKKDQKQTGAVFKTERPFYEELMTDTYKKLMEHAIVRDGY